MLRLRHAAGGGHLSCVQLLLDEGADIEQRNVVSAESGQGIFVCYARLGVCACEDVCTP